MTYHLSLKVEREYIIVSLFTDDKLPTFTEGRRKRNSIVLSFTDEELPTFTEGRKRITITNVP